MAPAVIHNSQATDDNLSDKPLAWTEYDDEELRDANTQISTSAPAVIHNSQAIDDDLGDEPLAWTEYDEEELRIDWTLNTSRE